MESYYEYQVWCDDGAKYFDSLDTAEAERDRQHSKGLRADPVLTRLVTQWRPV